jgi:YfiH family protein
LGRDGIYRCDALQQFIWQKHGFGTRESNPVADITLRQIHSSTVVNANGLRDREREGDALITDEVGKSIAIRTADCVPILLLDSKTRAIAAVHAGWRGAAAQVVTRTIERMHADFDTNPIDLYAAIGPCIRGCCYEVGPEVAASFDAGFHACDTTAAGKSKLNLAAANRSQMLAAGLDPARIFDCGLCTTCQSAQFFSYRREPENPGRMVAAISRLA